MDTVLLLIVAGLCAFSSYAEHEYHFVNYLKNMTDAQSYCREEHTDLATISNTEYAETLKNMAASRNIHYQAWIGLYDDQALDKWRWSLSDTSFYKPGEMEFRRWWHGGVDSKRSGEHCTRMWNTSLWYEDGCQNPYKPICSDVRGSNVTFVLINFPMTWTEAQSYCREHHTDLASVRNMTENQRVQELIPAGERAWIGLFRESWKWSDGSNSSFRYWRSGKPRGTQACVMADFKYSGRWTNRDCYLKKAFICYGPSKTTKQITTKQVFRVRLEKKDHSLDLNDPAVTESILKQLKQRLKGHGVNDNIKLSWRKQPDGKVFRKEEKKTKKKVKKDEL